MPMTVSFLHMHAQSSKKRNAKLPALYCHGRAVAVARPSTGHHAATDSELLPDARGPWPRRRCKRCTLHRGSSSTELRRCASGELAAQRTTSPATNRNNISHSFFFCFSLQRTKQSGYAFRRFTDHDPRLYIIGYTHILYIYISSKLIFMSQDCSCAAAAKRFGGVG